MAQFILIHGSWHGAWCWREIIPRLEARGHKVAAPDLPAHGADPAEPETVSLEDYVTRVVQTINHSDSQALVVGHSMGIIGLAAELVPDRIRALIYLSGLLPPNGSPLMQMVNGFDPTYLAEIQFSPDGRTGLLSAAGLRDFLYSCCPTDVVESALPLLTPEPVAPYEAPFVTTSQNFGRVRRYYVECLRDRVIPVALQRSMRASITFDGVYSIDTDHVPFFSAPDELANILHTIAAQA